MSGNLSTSDVKTGGGGMPKTIQPGNTLAKVLGIKLDQPHFLAKDNGYFVVLELEGPKPTEDFEGFFLNKDDESLGRHEGPVGRVKANRWAYKDGKTKGGTPIKRDNEIMKFLKNLCEAGGETMMKWWAEADEAHPTIEAFIEALNSDKPFDGVMFNFCIGGREYHKDNGYTAYDLHLPKFSKAGVPFESENAKVSRLIDFEEDTHIEKAEEKEVNSFPAEDGAADASAPSGGTEDVPEFEI